MTAGSSLQSRARRPRCRIPGVSVAGVLVAVAILAAGGGSPVFAQALNNRPPAPYWAWDASGGIGLHYVSMRDLDGSDYWADTKLQPRFQAGYYFSPHFKAEIAVAGPSTYDVFEVERIPVPGLATGGYAYTHRDVRLISLMPAFTYQFLENAFAHPFVSVGADVSLVDDHRFREEATQTSNRISYAVPALDTHASSVTTRPFVAAGFKSYFNERAFVRPELQVGFGRNGASRTNIRLDFGFDF
jgi:hypothetical protein